MMLPGITASPPYFFTPRRRPAESRPWREEPPAFVCAIGQVSLLRCQFFGLFDPAFTLDPALERQFLAEFFDICIRPCCDLGKGRDPCLVQLFLERRTNTRQQLEIVRAGSGLRRGGLLLSLGGRRLFGLRRRRRRRAGGRRDTGACTDRGFDAGGVRAGVEDIGHPQQRQLLTVTHGPLGTVLAAPLDEVDDLFTLDLVDHLGLHGCAVNQWRANDDLVATDHQNIIELYLFAGIRRQLFNAQHIARLDPVLLAAGFHHREHRVFSFIIRVLWPRSPGVSWGTPPRTARPARDVSAIKTKGGTKAPSSDARLMRRAGHRVNALSDTSPSSLVSKYPKGVWGDSVPPPGRIAQRSETGPKAPAPAFPARRPVPAHRKYRHTSC